MSSDIFCDSVNLAHILMDYKHGCFEQHWTRPLRTFQLFFLSTEFWASQAHMCKVLWQLSVRLLNFSASQSANNCTCRVSTILLAFQTCQPIKEPTNARAILTAFCWLSTLLVQSKGQQLRAQRFDPFVGFLKLVSPSNNARAILTAFCWLSTLLSQSEPTPAAICQHVTTLTGFRGKTNTE